MAGKGEGSKMQVFIEAERNSNIRSRFDEDSFALLGQQTLRRPYPYSYGFIPGTHTSAGDALDCYVITTRAIQAGELIECDPVDVFIQHENEEEDIKIIAVDKEKESDFQWENSIAEIQAFIIEIFRGHPEVNISFGPSMGREKAVEIIHTAQKH